MYVCSFVRLCVVVVVVVAKSRAPVLIKEQTPLTRHERMMPMQKIEEARALQMQGRHE
jgi:hypothetical protein